MQHEEVCVAYNGRLEKTRWRLCSIRTYDGNIRNWILCRRCVPSLPSCVFLALRSLKGDNEALPMKTEPKSNYQVSAERRKSHAAIQPARNVIPCEQRGMWVSIISPQKCSNFLIAGFGRIPAVCKCQENWPKSLLQGKNWNSLQP